MKLVFIPSFDYSSIPLFINIAKNADASIDSIYLDLSDPFLYYTNNKDINALSDYFNAIQSMEFTDYTFLNKYLKKNIFYKIFQFSHFISKLNGYQKKVISTISCLSMDAIVATSDSTFSSAIVNKWAVKNKIPFIIIQPTFIDTPKLQLLKILKSKILYFILNKLFSIPLMNRQNIFGNEYSSNYLFLWGKKFQSMYKDLPIKNHIKIVGNPVFDELRDNSFRNMDKINKIFFGKKVITICTEALQYTIKGNIDWINKIYIEVVKNNVDLFFIIKIHPRDNKEYYHSIFQRINQSNYCIIHDLSLYDVYKFTDIQISVNSYSSFEAVVCGIPIILFNKKLLSSCDYFEGEIELNAHSPDDLNKMIRTALSEEYQKIFSIKREHFLHSIIGETDGNSAKKIIKEIENIITSVTSAC